MKHINPIVAVLCGIVLGLFLFLVQHSNVLSYFSQDPRACINCHVMNTAYASWKHSSHSDVTCVACHMPQDSIIKALYAKATDGTKHAYFFTLEDRENFTISEDGANRVQKNCVSCHEDVMRLGMKVNEHEMTDGKKCWECHRGIPHGMVRGQSATPMGITLKESMKKGDK